MSKRLLVLLALSLLTAFTSASARPPNQLSADSCFDGLNAGTNVFPMVVSIQNFGPSADGNIVIEASSYNGAVHRYLYPVSLPTGTYKRVTVYPALMNGEDQCRVKFEGNANFPVSIVPLRFGDSNTGNIGLIGDRAGGMAALREVNLQLAQSPIAYSQTTRFTDSYSSPEDAPDRAIGYESFTAVVISDGAERLSPSQWFALHQWVLGGGTVILVGGAEAAYLKMPEAQPLIPLSNIHAVTINSLLLPTATDPVGPVALQTGNLKPGVTVHDQQNGAVLETTQRIGAGLVVYCAYNPLDQPVRSSPEIGTVWKQLVAVATPLAAIDQLHATASGDAGGYGSYGGYASSPYYPGGEQENPFEVKLPATSTIAWLLICYFIAVVPATFFVLRRFKRLEWAWVSSPVLSLLFAFGFFLFTANLYKASLSRRTDGLITAAAGAPQARFQGKTDIFFPRGGDYRLAIDRAESIETNNGYGEEVAGAIETVDTGAVVAPSFSATNLAFRSIEHCQPVNWGGGVTANLHMDADGNVAGMVTNATGEPLTGAMLYVPGRSGTARIGDMAVGCATRVATSDNGRIIPAWAQQYYNSMPALATAPDNTALLLATASGETFGPQMGHYVGGHNTIDVIVSLPIQGAAK